MMDSGIALVANKPITATVGAKALDSSEPSGGNARIAAARRMAAAACLGEVSAEAAWAPCRMEYEQGPMLAD